MLCPVAPKTPRYGVPWGGTAELQTQHPASQATEPSGGAAPAALHDWRPPCLAEPMLWGPVIAQTRKGRDAVVHVRPAGPWAATGGPAPGAPVGPEPPCHIKGLCNHRAIGNRPRLRHPACCAKPTSPTLSRTTLCCCMPQGGNTRTHNRKANGRRPPPKHPTCRPRCTTPGPHALPTAGTPPRPPVDVPTPPPPRHIPACPMSGTQWSIKAPNTPRKPNEALHDLLPRLVAFPLGMATERPSGTLSWGSKLLTSLLGARLGRE